MQQIALKAGVPVESFTLPHFPYLDYGSVREMGAFRDINWVSRLEQAATNYTDVFMTKHFPGEPWRGHYHNVWSHAHIDHYQLAIPGCGTYIPNVYQPASACLGNLGCLEQPSIIPFNPCKLLPPKQR
jgi:hypothetical protein